ncbi:MAG: tRNA threonylcarbamoyladenosine dehydratase, partial [Bacteroidaceae bacterium]|nr:tRNA threonylcarbamoyladenosine dehydratase [Bacteroidaceae bacterium]
GGVGSWCAESLVRTGIQHLTIVDADKVTATNINRQLMATQQTIGEPKVDALKQRLLTINPQAQINAIEGIYTEETADSFLLEDYDFIIDAIDSLTPKAHLILHATRVVSQKPKGSCHFFSSMGAALKLDATKIKIAEFWKVQGCPLARALRNKMKKQKTFPSCKFLCVYSDELLENKGSGIAGDTSPEAYHKAAFNGSLAHITATFGFFLAGEVIKALATLPSHK